MSKPLISVIIPVFNAQKFLSGTLESVQKQTLENIEIICVNDGSTDDSLQILNRFAQSDSRFKIFNQKNQGGSAARNAGLDYASGAYIAFLDNDDIYHPQYLKILYQNAINCNADVSCCSYLKFYGEKTFAFDKTYNVLPECHLVSEKPFLDKFKYKKKIGSLMWQKLYKAEVLKDIRFCLRLPAINDMLFNIEVLLKSQRTCVCREELIAYRIIETSQTMQKLSAKRIGEYTALAEEINLLSRKYPQHKKLLQKIASRYAFGMFVDEFLARYKPEEETEIYNLLTRNLKELIKKREVVPATLGFGKRLLLWSFANKKMCLLKFLKKNS